MEPFDGEGPPHGQRNPFRRARPRGDLVVVFNATPEKRSQTVMGLAGTEYTLHPTQAQGADPTVKGSSYEAESGTFAVPGRTVAVFARAAR